MERRHSFQRNVSVAVLVAGLLLLNACSSDSTDNAVCEASEEMRTALSGLADLSFISDDDASADESLKEIGESVDSLVAAAKSDFADETAAVKRTYEALESAAAAEASGDGSASQLGDALAAFTKALKTMAEAVAKACID